MSIKRIILERCNGCGICIDSCPVDVLRLGEGGAPWTYPGWKAVVAYPNDCHGCGLCRMDCPREAIEVSYEIDIPPACLPYDLLPPEEEARKRKQLYQLLAASDCQAP